MVEHLVNIYLRKNNMSEKDQEIKINTLEINQNNMAEKIDDLKKIVIDGFCKQENKLENFIKSVSSYNEKHLEESDKRYASKRVEKNVDRLSWLVISTIVSAILLAIITIGFSGVEIIRR